MNPEDFNGLVPHDQGGKVSVPAADVLNEAHAVLGECRKALIAWHSSEGVYVRDLVEKIDALIGRDEDDGREWKDKP